MSLKMACWEKPMADLPLWTLSCILLCTRATNSIKHSRSLSRNLLKNKCMPPPVPWGPHVPVCSLIYDILRGPRLSGNDYSISYFMHRHSCTTSHLQTRMPHEEICFLLQKNKPSLACEKTPCKDCNCIFTKEPKAAIVWHRGGPSHLKVQADRGVNLSPMLMRSREHSRGPEYQLQGWERGLFGEER